jgi:hypothetical protein
VPVTAERARRPWSVLLRPRWLAWHAFAVLATAGMVYLGDWQLHRAESGNELSWAYTFEWPLFAGFGVYFWIKSLRDEVRGDAAGDAGLGAQAAAAAGETAGVNGDERDTIGPDAVGAGSVSRGADAAVLAPSDGEAYVARLRAEVQRHGRWHRWR